MVSVVASMVVRSVQPRISRLYYEEWFKLSRTQRGSHCAVDDLYVHGTYKPSNGAKIGVSNSNHHIEAGLEGLSRTPALTQPTGLRVAIALFYKGVT